MADTKSAYDEDATFSDEELSKNLEDRRAKKNLDIHPFTSERPYGEPHPEYVGPDAMSTGNADAAHRGSHGPPSQAKRRVSVYMGGRLVGSGRAHGR